MQACEWVYLVDTNVISAAAPTKARASPELGLWMDRHSDFLYLSVTTVAAMEDGVALARRQGDTITPCVSPRAGVQLFAGCSVWDMSCPTEFSAAVPP